LRLFIAGHGSVLVFFVLSGFVLALPFASGHKLRLGDFLVRRFCRICPPFAASIMIAAALHALVGNGSVAVLSAWFNESWKDDISVALLVNHFPWIWQAPGHQP